MKITKISEVEAANMFVTVYGDSGVGKTRFISSFPKPLLLIDCGDRKYSHIKNVKGVYVADVDEFAQVIKILKSKDMKKFKTVVLDNLSGLMSLAREHHAKGKKQLSMQDWGNINWLLTDVIAQGKELSKERNFVLVGHKKVYDAKDGDDSVIDTITINSNPALKNWIEPNTNVAIYLSKFAKYSDELEADEDESEVSFGAIVGPHAHYWTNGQGLENVPEGIIYNPTYKKIFEYQDEE